MLITNKNLRASVQGIDVARPTHETGTFLELHEQLNQMQQKFGIEKNAKNQAYCFIIMLDLMEAFKDFCQNVTADDWQKACIDALEIKSSENK